MTTIQRTAVLTGATSERGIGITTARRYAREGWGIVVLDLDGEKSAKVAAEIGNEFNVPAFGHEIDVASEASVIAAQAAVAAEVAAGNLPPVGLEAGPALPPSSIPLSVADGGEAERMEQPATSAPAAPAPEAAPAAPSPEAPKAVPEPEKK